MIDEGFGTTFDQHVVAGYRFIMRYYLVESEIYIFGFSRGAFTARFLARMISTIGLLSMGNEEMVPFAYKSYQDYEMGTGRFTTVQDSETFMKKFKTSFCRANVKIHFLGLFDTVNSVGNFDVPLTKQTFLPTVIGTAMHIRHAVSIDERRCKFKPALLQQDLHDAQSETEDIKEVFFAGNHGDVGGGWLAEGKLDVEEADDPVQLSDITMNWMIDEILALPAENDEDRITWNEHKDIFLKNFHRKEDEAVIAKLHDVLIYGGGTTYLKTAFWKFVGKLYYDLTYECFETLVTSLLISHRNSSRPQTPRTRPWTMEDDILSSQLWLQTEYSSRRGYTSERQSPDGED